MNGGNNVKFSVRSQKLTVRRRKIERDNAGHSLEKDDPEYRSIIECRIHDERISKGYHNNAKCVQQRNLAEIFLRGAEHVTYAISVFGYDRLVERVNGRVANSGLQQCHVGKDLCNRRQEPVCLGAVIDQHQPWNDQTKRQYYKLIKKAKKRIGSRIVPLFVCQFSFLLTCGF